MLPVKKLGGFTAAIMGLAVLVTVASAQIVPPAPEAPTAPGPIQQVFELTQSTPPGAPVGAFAVPAGTRLVITDVVITNPNVLPACGVGVSRGVAPAAGQPALQSVTGALCVPAQSTLHLALVTGLEFGQAESVLLVNGATGTAEPVGFHLRGVLLVATTSAGAEGTSGATGPA